MAQWARHSNRGVVEIKLQDAIAATDNGKWFELPALDDITVDVFGTFSGGITIMGSNEDDQPTDATDGRIIGSEITTASITAIAGPVKYIKAKCTTYTSGAITVKLLGLERR